MLHHRAAAELSNLCVSSLVVGEFQATRKEYVDYGASTGDRMRLADSDLWLALQNSLLPPGDEIVFGEGKV